VPRRAIAAVAGTVTGLALVLSFKTPHRAAHAGATPVATTPTTGPGDAGPFGREDPEGTPASTQPGPATTGGGSAAVSYKDGTQPGAVVQTEFGDLQVQVTTKDGKITDVTTLATPWDRRRSEEINSYATPILHDEVLAAQSARIDTVSGATITSDAYEQSLQAALDSLRS